jgi:hypothetical protein
MESRLISVPEIGRFRITVVESPIAPSEEGYPVIFEKSYTRHSNLVQPRQ